VIYGNSYSRSSRYSLMYNTEDSGGAIISADTTMNPYTLYSLELITLGFLRAYLQIKEELMK